MKTCSFCKEEIKEDAIKCKYCQSILVDLSQNLQNSETITYVVDKGLLRFGKFVSAALALFIAVGLMLYGYDLTKMADELDEAARAVQTAQAQIADALSKAEEGARRADEITKRVQGLEQGVAGIADNFTRRAAFATDTIQDRVRKLLAAIDTLPDAKAFELEKNPPVQNSKNLDQLVKLRDPTNLRARNADVAREMLKMSVVLGERDNATLNAWEAAISPF